MYILWHAAHYMTPVRWPLSEVQALRGFDRYDVAERCKELMRRLPGLPDIMPHSTVHEAWSGCILWTFFGLWDIARWGIFGRELVQYHVEDDLCPTVYWTGPVTFHSFLSSRIRKWISELSLQKFKCPFMQILLAMHPLPILFPSSLGKKFAATRGIPKSYMLVVTLHFKSEYSALSTSEIQIERAWEARQPGRNPGICVSTEQKRLTT